MKYTIKQLNTYIKDPVEDNIVVHVKNKGDWYKLKAICPEIIGYNSSKDYYLTSSGGYSNTEYYKTIEINEIEFEDKKIIGYLAPTNLFGGLVLKDCIYTWRKLEYTYMPSHGWGLDKHFAPIKASLPKEIVEAWEPVYKEKCKEIKIGTPLRDFIINKDSIDVYRGDNSIESFTKADLFKLLTIFSTPLAGIGNFDCWCSAIQVGCKEEGVALTKENLETIKLFQDDL